MLRFILIIIGMIFCPFVNAQTVDCKNVTAYGADPTGASSSNLAFNNAVASTNGRNICIYFPAGNYRFTAPLQVSLTSTNATASVTIQGDGSETTQLRFEPDITGINITLNAQWQSFHVKDLSVLAGNKSTVTHGIAVNNNSGILNSAQSHISHVTVRGADGYNQSFRWARGVGLYRVSNVNVSDTTIVGSSDGAAYASTGACLIAEGTQAVLPVQINVVSSQLNYCQYGIYYGNYLQGVQVTATNFVGNSFGLYLPSGQVGNDQLSISASQFNNSVSDIYTASLIDGVTITGNVLYGGAVSGTIPVNLNHTDQFSIVGNTFINLGPNGPNQNAIVINDYVASSGVITGNVFKNGFVTAIWLTPSSQRVNVQSNSYFGQPNTVINQGTNNTIGGGTP